MANRAHMDVAPENVFDRAQWLDARLPRELRSIPMASGMSGITELERILFPPSAPVVALDPKCPQCGVETHDGTVERQGDHFQVAYLTCGHRFLVPEDKLLAGHT